MRAGTADVSANAHLGFYHITLECGITLLIMSLFAKVGRGFDPSVRVPQLELAQPFSNMLTKRG